MIANAIVENLKGEYTTSVVGGFINFKINNSMLANAVAEILTKKAKTTVVLKVFQQKKSYWNMFQLTLQDLSISGTGAGLQWEVLWQIFKILWT